LTLTRSIHIVPSIANEASGPSYSVVSLCRALIGEGHPTKLSVLEPIPVGAELDFVTSFAYGVGSRRLGSSPKMKHWLRQEACR
jgi:hypothetical protein